jgi:hypothetical protein
MRHGAGDGCPPKFGLYFAGQAAAADGLAVAVGALADWWLPTDRDDARDALLELWRRAIRPAGPAPITSPSVSVVGRSAIRTAAITRSFGSADPSVMIPILPDIRRIQGPADPSGMRTDSHHAQDHAFGSEAGRAARRRQR